jgi:hypothetical protein
MPTISPRTVEFTYMVAPAIRITATEVGNLQAYSANSSSPGILKIMRETMDKVLDQCFQSTPAAFVPIAPFVVTPPSDLSSTPAYKIKQTLKKYPAGNTVVTEIDVVYHVADCSFNISAWDSANPLVRYINADTDDPRLIKEMLARIVTDYKAPGGLMVTTINDTIKLT